MESIKPELRDEIMLSKEESRREGERERETLPVSARNIIPVVYGNNNVSPEVSFPDACLEDNRRD